MCEAGDRLFSLLALLMTALLGLNVMTDAPSTARPSAPSFDVPDDLLEARVNEIAEAIATAEGYYADGEHDGHSLPYRLNNPGALKQPALGGIDLPTWQDTGLVVFPSADRGWMALRHQIRLMLSGDSRIYHPSDTLLAVAAKYTGGDASRTWGHRVAAELGVEPAATLAEVITRAPGSEAEPR
jgi:hypothetical protein